MADVTISSLPTGAPSGNALLPYSNGASTLGVPVSAIFHNAGNIGIGTATPGATLDISAGVINGSHVGPSLRLTNGFTDQGAATWVPNTDYAGSVDYFTVDGSGGGGGPGPNVISFIRPYVQTTIGYGWSLAFGVSTVNEPATERMRIASTGNVGIGTTAPQAKLDVAGNVRASGFSTGSLPVYGANAFVHFNGTQDVNGNTSTANTTRRIYASGNVSSVLRNSTGLYTIYFTTAMTITEYMAVCSARHQDGITWDVHFEVSDRLTTSCLVNIAGNPAGAASATNYDCRDVDVMIIC